MLFKHMMQESQLKEVKVVASGEEERKRVDTVL